MKKNLFRKVSVLAIAILTLTFSCTRENDGVIPDLQNEMITTNSSNFARNANLSKEELIEQLSQDENFIQLGNAMEDFFFEMPQKENFLNNYDEQQFQSSGAQYFLNLSGYTDGQVSSRVVTIHNLLLNLTNDYPELQFNEENEDFVLEVLEGATAIIEASKPNLPGCRACVKKWKPRMVWSLGLGAIAGGYFGGGYFGAWAGATLGFASAGWGLVDCLEANGC